MAAFSSDRCITLRTFHIQHVWFIVEKKTQFTLNLINVSNTRDFFEEKNQYLNLVYWKRWYIFGHVNRINGCTFLCFGWNFHNSKVYCLQVDIPSSTKGIRNTHFHIISSASLGNINNITWKIVQFLLSKQNLSREKTNGDCIFFVNCTRRKMLAENRDMTRFEDSKWFNGITLIVGVKLIISNEKKTHQEQQ